MPTEWKVDFMSLNEYLRRYTSPDMTERERRILMYEWAMLVCPASEYPRQLDFYLTYRHKAGL